MQNLELIKEKMKLGEGYVKMEHAGLIKVSEMNPNDNIIWQPTKHDYKIINNELVLKTEEDYQQEENLKNCQAILNKLQPLISAINTQKTGFDLGIPEKEGILTQKEMKDWILYISAISKGNINAEMPEISDTVKLITGL